MMDHPLPLYSVLEVHDSVNDRFVAKFAEMGHSRILVCFNDPGVPVVINACIQTVNTVFWVYSSQDIR